MQIAVCRLRQTPGNLPHIPHGRRQRAGELAAGETRNACFSAAVVAEWACKPARSARHSRKLRLIRSGEPSRISLRKRRISPLLKTSPECPLRDMRQVSRLGNGRRYGVPRLRGRFQLRRNCRFYRLPMPALDTVVNQQCLRLSK